MNRIFAIFLFGCIAFALVADEPNLSLQKASSEPFQAKIAEIYTPFSKLTASFVIKGKVGRRDVYYSGTIKSTGKMGETNLSISLRDPVFKSTLFILKVKNGIVMQNDILNERKTRVPIDKYKWVQVFGHVFPFKFFLPLLKGFPPSQVFLPEAKYRPEKSRVVYKAKTYDMVLNLKDYKMKKLYFRSKIQASKVTVIRFMGNAKNKAKRAFPKTLLITQNKSKDYLKLDFRRVTIK